MNNIKNNRRIKELGTLKDLFSVEHHTRAALIVNLKPQNAAKIRQIAKGELKEVNIRDRIKAGIMLGYLKKDEDCKVLGKIISNSKEDIDLRTSMAHLLADFTPVVAEKELIKQLKVKEDRVLEGVIRSLGVVGNKDALKSLTGIRNVKEDFVKKQLAFSKALIVHRENLDEDPLPFVKGVTRMPGEDSEMIKLTVKSSGKRKLAETKERFEGSRYNIGLSDSTGFEVNAGKANWVLFINEEPAKAGILKYINSRKTIMGLLSRRLDETSTFSPQYVVLTKPVGRNKVQIMVVRTDGEIFYSGEANVRNNIMSFLISDIKRRGTAPTNVKGKLTLSGVKLEMTVPFGKRVNQRPTVDINLADIAKKYL